MVIALWDRHSSRLQKGRTTARLCSKRWPTTTCALTCPKPSVERRRWKRCGRSYKNQPMIQQTVAPTILSLTSVNVGNRQRLPNPSRTTPELTNSLCLAKVSRPGWLSVVVGDGLSHCASNEYDFHEKLSSRDSQVMATPAQLQMSCRDVQYLIGTNFSAWPCANSSRVW